MRINERDFCDATASWNYSDFADGASWVCEPEDVVVSAERVADFVAARGAAHEEFITKIGILFIWNKQQSRPGCRRGDLFVMDSGDGTLAYFGGES